MQVGKDSWGRFDSELTGGVSMMRIVGWQRDVLEMMQASAVVLRNCQTI